MHVAATNVNFLANATVRANDRIQIEAQNDWLELGGSDIGILIGSTRGDILISGQSANVTAANLTAPDMIQINGQVGTPNSQTTGTVSCVLT